MFFKLFIVNHFLIQKFKDLSTGEQRIVEMFIILNSKAKLYLLEEPFSQIMPLQRETINKKEKKNKGIIISDHIYKYVLEVSDDIYILKNGKTHLKKELTEIESLAYANL